MLLGFGAPHTPASCPRTTMKVFSTSSTCGVTAQREALATTYSLHPPACSLHSAAKGQIGGKIEPLLEVCITVHSPSSPRLQYEV